MIRFKSKHILVHRTDLAHVIQKGRRNTAYWIPASVCKCTKIDVEPGTIEYTPHYQCELKQWYADKNHKLIPELIEGELIWDVEEIKDKP